MVWAEQIDLSHAIRIAHASSKREGDQRWTELNAYFLNEPDYRRKQWLTERLRHSAIEGEVTKRDQVIQAGTIESAFRQIGSTDLGTELSLQALRWKEENAAMIEAFYQENRKGDPGKVRNDA